MEFSERRRWLWLEFAVIMLGVLSALLVDTWIQDREDSRRAEIYRVRLIADLESDKRNIDARIAYYGRIRHYALAVIEMYEGRGQLEDFDLLFSAFNAAEEWGFTSEASTFIDMQNTGGLGLFEDLRLRLALARYHRELSTRSVVWALPDDFRVLARGIIPNDLQTAIHQQCNTSVADVVLGDFDAAPGIYTSLLASDIHCELDRTEFDVAAAATQLREHPDAVRLLRYRASQIRVSISLFKGQKKMADEVLMLLREPSQDK